MKNISKKHVSNQDEKLLIIGHLVSIHNTLTMRELEICSMIAQSLPSGEIIKEMKILPHSFYEYRSRIRKKLNLAKKQSLTGYLIMLRFSSRNK